MSDFDKQIRERKNHNELHLHRAVHLITGTVNREEIPDSGMHLNDEEDAALYDICRYYGLEDKELSPGIPGSDAQDGNAGR